MVHVLSVSQLLSLPGAKAVLIAFFCYCGLETTTGLWGGSYMVMQKCIFQTRIAKHILFHYN